MTPTPGSVRRAANADLERLRAEYADRDRRFADSDRYSLSNPANLFLVQQRQRAGERGSERNRRLQLDGSERGKLDHNFFEP